MMKNAKTLARITARDLTAPAMATNMDTAATAVTVEGKATGMDRVVPSTRPSRTERRPGLTPLLAMLDWDVGTERLLGAWYPGFARVPVPDLGGARRAWRGPLQPLGIADEVTAIISDLEADAAVHILDGGTLHHRPDCGRNHADLWYGHRLRRMDVRFDIVLLDLGREEHPQVFCVRPEISARAYPTHPHLRLDRLACIDGRVLPALCTYFASDGSLQHDEMKLVRALDFASIFLAKNLVWLRTATLVALWPGCPPRELAEDSGLALHLPFCDRNPNLRWVGHWPGPVAPHGPSEMLKAVPLSAECPCGSRKAYGDCCRPRHKEWCRRSASAHLQLLLA